MGHNEPNYFPNPSRTTSNKSWISQNKVAFWGIVGGLGLGIILLLIMCLLLNRRKTVDNPDKCPSQIEGVSQLVPPPGRYHSGAYGIP